MANAFGAESFLSIHANAFTDPVANGTETYAWAEGTVAAEQRDQIHEAHASSMGVDGPRYEDSKFFRAAEYHDARFALRDGLYQQPRRCLASG